MTLCAKYSVAEQLASLGDPAALQVAAALAQHAARLQPECAATTAQRVNLLAALHTDGQLPAHIDVGSTSGLLDAALVAQWGGRLQDAHQSLELAALAGGGSDAQRRSLQALLALLEGSDAEVVVHTVVGLLANPLNRTHATRWRMHGLCTVEHWQHAPHTTRCRSSTRGGGCCLHACWLRRLGAMLPYRASRVRACFALQPAWWTACCTMRLGCGLQGCCGHPCSCWPGKRLR